MNYVWSNMVLHKVFAPSYDLFAGWWFQFFKYFFSTTKNIISCSLLRFWCLEWCVINNSIKQPSVRNVSILQTPCLEHFWGSKTPSNGLLVKLQMLDTISFIRFWKFQGSQWVRFYFVHVEKCVSDSIVRHAADHWEIMCCQSGLAEVIVETVGWCSRAVTSLLMTAPVTTQEHEAHTALAAWVRLSVA